jgi:ribosomal protein S18 acetylase RimI-like enzyme
MFENSFERQKSKEQGILVDINIATEKDWEFYRDLKLKSIANEQDKKMLGITDNKIKEWNENRDNPEYWKNELQPNNTKFILLAFDEPEKGEKKDKKEALGTISAKTTTEEGLWYIYASYVRSDIRGKGLGEAILATCLDEIELRGGYRASMLVNIENEKQLGLISKFYFKIDKKRKVLLELIATI